MDIAQELAYNILILTVYGIVVALVFNKAVKALDAQAIVQTDSEYLKEQLAENKLDEFINIKFSFPDTYKVEDFKTIAMEIKNKSTEAMVEVDWKDSLISDFEKNARRLIRVIPGKNEASQAASTILPGATLKEQLSDEKVTAPLFDPGKLKKAAAKNDRFSILLLLKIKEPSKSARSCPLRCQFIVKKLLWQKALSLAFQPK
ncbi:MAG TPA: hypothetical protein DEG17_10885 [Cyanobacteria bacterium UBA11149]|nr:hypothetical protein [Cyanobacteria bacterium UBA11367]HBE58848.1 hypothetical protein [Cyanobacteria bacterium UBA11366]HBK63352.1 hypothetical protein [Cyanobacteria bacterium UBA11166]HBR72335.1 hypothetical protein [Cyanobacteria bacterium UBA11159]HBS70409.1 hypothetical protein [Cyanobacteria bacterium UBA11153]HBW89353.1 hypothetical protein [Cyanobacteria bacterium UBA11149]HCA97661.1 hypothetical protein [Cyanobacteria bacterium UBA9226]